MREFTVVVIDSDGTYSAYTSDEEAPTILVVNKEKKHVATVYAMSCPVPKNQWGVFSALRDVSILAKNALVFESDRVEFHDPEQHR